MDTEHETRLFQILFYPVLKYVKHGDFMVGRFPSNLSLVELEDHLISTCKITHIVH